MRIKRFLSMTLAVAMCVCMIPFSNVHASGIEWKSLGNHTYALEGTDIVITIQGESMNISGTGSLPDYDVWSLDSRPWRGHVITSVTIADTIHSVGTNFFGKMDSIKYVTMGTSTFIEDFSSFSGVGYTPIFRIFNTGVTTEMIGTIPYTSMDSIIHYAQSNAKGEAYIFDDSTVAREFQNSTNPTIKNVYTALDKEAPWNNLADYSNGNVSTKMAVMTEDTRDYPYRVEAQLRVPGKACYQAFAAFIGDYKYACSVNMSVYQLDKKVETMATPHKYVIDIPKKYIGLGTSYKLLGIGKGVVDSYEDLDKNPATITFETTYPSTTFAIVYK